MSRVAILSDVHSNYCALQAVVADIERRNVDSMLMLGDAVGYGPEPHRCIELLMTLVQPDRWIRGNHDSAVACFSGAEDLVSGELPSDLTGELKQHLGSNQDAIKAAWQNYELLRLRPTLLRHVSERSARLVVDSELLLVHGGLRNGTPETTYTTYRWDARDELKNKKKKPRLILLGHTHVPACFAAIAGDDGAIDCEQVRLDTDGRVFLRDRHWVINPGSIGQPRDGDPRASYMILDRDARVVELHRVEYDLGLTQEKMNKLKLPENLSNRLAEGR